MSYHSHKSLRRETEQKDIFISYNNEINKIYYTFYYKTEKVLTINLLI